MLLEAARPTVTQPSSGKTTPAGTMGLSSTTSRGWMIPEKSSASPAIVRSEARSSRRVSRSCDVKTGTGRAPSGNATSGAAVAPAGLRTLPTAMRTTCQMNRYSSTRMPILRTSRTMSIIGLSSTRRGWSPRQPRSVGRPEVAQHVAVALAADLGVLARDVGVGEDDAAAAAAPEHGDVLAQLPLTLRAAQRGAGRAASCRRGSGRGLLVQDRLLRLRPRLDRRDQRWHG